MFNKRTKIILFFSSYAPLFAILGIRIAPSIESYALWGLSLLSILFAALFFTWMTNNISVHQIQVRELSSQSEVLGFIVTYVIPFVTFNINTWQDWASLLLLLIVIAILYVNSSLVYVNPVLAILGWHTYSITVETQQRILITRQTYDQPPTASLNVVTLGDKFLLEKK